VSFAFPLERIHPQARQASEAAECAARQGRFWQMHEQLFASANALAADDLVNRAESIGLDLEQFKRCLAGAAAAKIAGDVAVARRLDVSSTPTFFVGLIEADGSIRLQKRLNGAVPFEHFEAAVNEISGTKLSLLER
jgi:protein-disulfide isomerase